MIIRVAFIFIPVIATLIAHVTPPQTQTKYSVLAIEYVGPSDKPIDPIVISDTQAGAEYYKTAVLGAYKWDPVAVHVVTAPFLDGLITQAESFSDSVHDRQENLPGRERIVSVTIIKPEYKKTFSYGTESAISYLDSLKENSKGNEPLQSDVVYFRKRIRL